jgi:hypothetical protein
MVFYVVKHVWCCGTKSPASRRLRRDARDRYCFFPPTEWLCSICPSESGRPRKVLRGWPGSPIDGRNLPHQPPAGTN